MTGLLSEDLCRSIIAAYDSDPEKSPGRTATPDGEYVITPELKIATDLPFKWGNGWAPLYREANDCITGAAFRVLMKIPTLNTLSFSLTPYQIQHYKKGEGHFNWHCDALGPATQDRQLAMILYLNSVDDGGETRFQKQELSIQPVAGSAIFFPTFWTHRHCGMIPKSSDKYIVTSFIKFLF